MGHGRGQRAGQRRGHSEAGIAVQGQGQGKRAQGTGLHLSAIDDSKASGGEAAPAVAPPHLYLGGPPHQTHPGAAMQSGPLVILPRHPGSQPRGSPNLYMHTPPVRPEQGPIDPPPPPTPTVGSPLGVTGVRAASTQSSKGYMLAILCTDVKRAKAKHFVASFCGSRELNPVRARHSTACARQIGRACV